MQVKIGNGGGGGGVRMQLGRGVIGSALSPDNWIYIAAAVVLIVIVIALAVLIVREYNLQKKNKG